MDEPLEKPPPTEGAPQVQSCKVCGESLRGPRTVVQCARCRTLHHLDCWRFNKGCAVYGCGCRSWEEPSGSISLAVPLRFERVPVGSQAPSRVLGAVAFLPLFVLVVVAVGVGIEVSPFLAVIPGALAALCGWAGVRYGIMREWLHSHPAGGTLQRTLELFGVVMSRRDDWLVAAEVVELQFHAIEFGRGGMDYRLCALLLDGERRLLCRDVGLATPAKAAQFERLVDGLAVSFDCTVRRIRSAASPSSAEIAEAIAQKRLAAPAAAPPGSAPPKVDPPKPAQPAV